MWDLLNFRKILTNSSENSLLKSATFHNSVIGNSNFHNATLRTADLSNANIKNTDFRSSDFSYSDLSYVSFEQSDLRNMYHYNAITTGAVLIDSDFNGCLGQDLYNRALSKVFRSLEEWNLLITPIDTLIKSLCANP